MFLPDMQKDFVYERNTLFEVICQLRFPAIDAIELEEPAGFKELIIRDFTEYIVKTERLPSPKGPVTLKNHEFISADRKNKFNLTKGFISLSTRNYDEWQGFAAKLDEPLGRFIEMYAPESFERIGLRYMNAVSRRDLGLEHLGWRDLIAEPYLGVLALGDMDEAKLRKCSVEVEMELDGNRRMKLRAGPGSLRRLLPGEKKVVLQERETKFVLDIDVFTVEKTPLKKTAETLDDLHRRADAIFGDAITDTLHEAMGPVYRD